MQNPKNYFPISLLLSMSQLFEKKILINRLESFWEKCDVLKSKQNGFPEKNVNIERADWSKRDHSGKNQQKWKNYMQIFGSE